MEDFFNQLKGALGQFAIHFGMALLVMAGFWLASRVAEAVISRIGRRFGHEREEVLMLVAQMTRISILVFGVVTALGTAGLNVSALVAGLGLTGFALGFAFRDALSNLLAGFMVLLYRPFRRGDVITVTGLEGKVIEINLRYTVIQSETARVLIPNANLLTNPIVVRSTTTGDQVSPVSPIETVLRNEPSPTEL